LGRTIVGNPTGCEGERFFVIRGERCANFDPTQRDERIAPD
jgi:hypothetical protein